MDWALGLAVISVEELDVRTMMRREGELSEPLRSMLFCEDCCR